MILKTLDDLNRLSKLNHPTIMIEDLIEKSANPYMLLDNIYKMRWQGPTINSYTYKKLVYINRITSLINERIDDCGYDDIVQEVMSLFEETSICV